MFPWPIQSRQTELSTLTAESSEGRADNVGQLLEMRGQTLRLRDNLLGNIIITVEMLVYRGEG